MSNAAYTKRQNEIWATYTDAERKGMGIYSEHHVPGTRDDVVLRYLSPTRLQKDFAELRKLDPGSDDDLFRTTVVHRDNLGDGWTLVTYLFERLLGVTIEQARLNVFGFPVVIDSTVPPGFVRFVPADGSAPRLYRVDTTPEA